MMPSPQQILLGRRNQGELDGRGIWHAWVRKTFILGFGGET
jgi:hypothetical protein